MAIIVQAVVMMNVFNHNFSPPILKDEPLAFQPIGDVLLIDYVLNSLALGGVDEAILFSCQDDGVNIKDYIRDRVSNKAPWSLTMDVQVMMSETCQTMGDVMREIDAAAIIRGHFILTGINTITNINFATLLEQHLQLYEKDKDAAMTLVYKEAASEHPLITSDTSTFLAVDGNTNKVLFHQKYQQQSKDKTINLPLEITINHSGVKQQRNLIDTNIALCSPSVLQLFRENFDFQTRDDFIHALLINEKKLASTLYYTLVKPGEYAAAITNWRNYEIIRRDIIHKRLYPLTIETGRSAQGNILNDGYDIFRCKDAMFSRFCSLEGDILFGENTRRSTRDTKIRRFGDNVFTTDTIISKMGTGNILTRSLIDESSDAGSYNTLTDSKVTTNSKMGDHNTLTDSLHTIGSTMGDKNTLTNTVINTYSTLGAGNTLTGCQISNHVTIGSNCALTGCTIRNYHVIKDGSVLTDQIIG